MVFPAQSFSTGAKPYVVVTPSPNMVFSIAEFKNWAKVFNDLEDDIISQIIVGVTAAAEKYTKRVFLTTEFETKRDVFGDIDESPAPGYICLNQPIVLRKSPFQSLTSIQYLKDNVLTSLLNTQIAFKSDYSQIYPPVNETWPDPDTGVVYPITVTFKAGYGDTGADVPEDLLNALLAHMTWVYKNRGDCLNIKSGCSCQFAPPQAVSVYNQYRILEFRAF